MNLPAQIHISLPKAVKRLTKRYKELLNRGESMTGPLKEVTDDTMNRPIRSTDRRIRREVNPVQRHPIKATGETINSIHGVRVNDKEFRIESRTARGDKILSQNVKYGRYPLVVADQTINIVEKEILKHIDSVLRTI